MALPLLYTFRRCPYAMRTRMALIRAGRPFEAVDGDWFARQALPATQRWLSTWQDNPLFAAATVKS